MASNELVCVLHTHTKSTTIQDISIYIAWLDVLELNKPCVHNVRNKNYITHCVLRSQRVSRLFEKISRML